MIFFIVLLLLIIVLSLLSKDLFRNIIEPLQTSIGTNKGTLYILLEAPGFNVPELQVTKELMSPSVAQSKFSKVVVIANSAKYKNPSTDSNIMTDQWDNILVQNLGLPVERWCFVCCSSNAPGGINANTLINNLTTNFTNIKGFLIDSEDDPTSIVDFVNEFNSKSNIKISLQLYTKWEANKDFPTNEQIAKMEKILCIKLPRNKKIKIEN